MIPQSKRRYINNRDEGRCQLCGTPATEIHHIILGGMGRKRNHSPANLISLCGHCHRACHTGKHTQKYQLECIEWSRKKYGDEIDLIQREKWRGKYARPTQRTEP